MSTVELTQERVRTRGAAALGVAGFAVAIALASQVSIPLPGTAVPLTLQPMLVVLAGLMLGPRLGALSVALWIAAGIAGLPVFTPGGAPGIARLLGPTGGYITAYPVAAFAAGYIASLRPGFANRLAGALAGMALLHVGGFAQLAILTGSFSAAAVAGVAPFAAADAAKAIVAAMVARAPVAKG